MLSLFLIIKGSSLNLLTHKINFRMIINGLPKKINLRLYSSSQVARKTFGSDSIRSKTKCYITISDTPLGKHAAGSTLLDGLDVFTVNAGGDDHPLSVFGINSADPIQSSHDENLVRPILLLHGRTWSSIPVYHLLGGSKRKSNGEENRSLMEKLLEYGLQPYAMDFRGFGGTPNDATKCVEPFCCVSDVETVLKWISKRHGMDSKLGTGDDVFENPALLGWSQGALVAQMVAQKRNNLISKLVLYGSIYDPLIRYPREPLYTTTPVADLEIISNTANSAMEDFTIEGSISLETASRFAEAALITDPHKAVWKDLYQFNNLDPAQVQIPTLVVAGDQDPYAPLRVQAELFSNLGRGSDRTWSILADADHAVHLLDGQQRFAKIVSSFVKNGKRSDNSYYF
mmetsp:Transcript_1604/g.1951  ORF Transcript_1604/g.1951 Transcript_1604/m.1951 type:complete len:400 (+) Transcript_1604:146-1345(+)